MLLAALAIVAPIFGLVALGYGAARSRLVSGEAGNALSEYVFVLAIPALLFRTVASADFPALNPLPYWISYFGALAICWTIAGLLARRDGRDAREAAVIGFSAAQSNTVLVGIPLILGTIGEAGTLPVILLLAVHLPVTMTAVTLLIARGESGPGAWKGLLRSLVTHPILIAIGGGLLWRYLGIPIPDLMRTLLKYLADSAAPCALAAMGMSMTRVSLAGNRRMIGLIAAIKLLLHPLLVYVLTVHIMRLPPPFAGAAILFAACPTGINAFLVAERYRVGASLASGAITLSTLLAIVTMTLAVSVTMALVK
ncbi:MAG: AEC family transporter [Beijerinckiaceae bacterium]|nr:AEC family transporter [Beijerinckiaceae bacterium]